MKKLNKKAFTLIELLVVIAVIGILVLFGAPRFTGYTQKAEDARIQHDIKVMEQEVGAVLINNEDDFNKWEYNIKDLNQLIEENELFEKEGYATELEPTDGHYKIIPEKYKDKINTKLKGTFYAHIGGKVYYEHGKGPGYSEEETGYSDEEINDLVEIGFIPIAWAEELNSIRNATVETYGKGTKWEGKYLGGLDKKYIQVADIDLRKFTNFEPIGKFNSDFTGIYDGGGYVISNLTIDMGSASYVGLFGRAIGATFKNVGLEDVNVTGGALTGGLVGYQYGSSTVTNSYTTGSVNGGNYVGGLVGSQFGSSTVSNSYATGSVTGTGNPTGGLVGGQRRSSTVTNSYATGNVTGTGITGGLVGYQDESSVSNSYYDTETTKRSDTGKGEGKTTVEMKNKDTYVDWDFESIWTIENNQYPTLR